MLVVSAGWDIETGVDVLTVEMLKVEVDTCTVVMDVRSCDYEGGCVGAFES